MHSEGFGVEVVGRATRTPRSGGEVVTHATDVLHDLVHPTDQPDALVPGEDVTPDGLGRADRPRDRHDHPPQQLCCAGRAEGTAARRRFDDQRALSQRGDQPIANEEAIPGRHRTRRVFGEHQAGAGDVVDQSGVAGWVWAVDAAGQHRDRDAADGERSAVGNSVDAQRRTRDHAEPTVGEAGGQCRATHAP